jgi:flagellar protein FlaG
MSNDIQTHAARVTEAPTPKPAAPSVDMQTRPQAPVETKPVIEKRLDPQEARRTLEEATEHLNKQMSRNSRDLSFSVDDVANKVVVTVKSRESGEVVRQIPSEVALRVAHNLEDMKGLLLDGKS